MANLSVCVVVIVSFLILLQQHYVASDNGMKLDCKTGEVWDSEQFECVRVKSKKRKATCKYGFAWNERLQECRRLIYHAKQEDGRFKKWWYSRVGDKSGEHAFTRRIVATTTAYTDGWYGYGYGFGRDDPHF